MFIFLPIALEKYFSYVKTEECLLSFILFYSNKNTSGVIYLNCFHFLSIDFIIKFLSIFNYNRFHWLILILLKSIFRCFYSNLSSIQPPENRWVYHYIYLKFWIKSLMKTNLQKSRSWHFEVLVTFYCYKLWNFTEGILHRKLKFWYNLVRTFVSGTEFCLDVQSSLYLICNPSIKPGPLYQVGNNIQNGGNLPEP